MVGTKVRDSKNEKAMASITASAMGTNKKRDTPSKKNMGTNTIQIHSREIKAGVTICAAPSKMAVSTSLPCSRCQLMFSMVTVASSTKIPTAKAKPPKVMRLRVSPRAAKPIRAPNIDKGIEMAMMTVERQLPRKRNTKKLVNAAAMAASIATALMAALTKMD